MEILLVLAVGALCIGCFVVGAKVGQQAAKGEPVKVEIPDPMQAIRRREARKEAEFERSKVDTILANIERYDGTPDGQKDVP